jgi:DNA-binding LacI/PurR family transcriptional regulator
MPKPDLTTIEERLEGVAADALEKIIDDVEKNNQVHVTDMTVELIPDQGLPAGSPTVEVSVSMESSKPRRSQA